MLATSSTGKAPATFMNMSTTTAYHMHATCFPTQIYQFRRLLRNRGSAVRQSSQGFSQNTRAVRRRNSGDVRLISYILQTIFLRIVKRKEVYFLPKVKRAMVIHPNFGALSIIKSWESKASFWKPKTHRADAWCALFYSLVA